eukprot:scaffold260504_cov28-Prasinocladus_malaysianus.AAC.1
MDNRRLTDTVSIKLPKPSDALKHEFDAFALVGPQPAGEHRLHFHLAGPVCRLPQYEGLWGWLFLLRRRILASE